MIPFIKIFGRFSFLNFNKNRNIHIANRANTDCFRSYCK